MREKLNRTSSEGIFGTPSMNGGCSNTLNSTIKKRYSSSGPDASQGNGSPSKLSCCSPSYAKPTSNSYVLCSSQANSNHRHKCISLVQAKHQKQSDSLEQEGKQFTTLHPMQSRETSFETNSSIGSGNGTSSERSTKYGYNIRETSDAHEVIMGDTTTRELRIELATTRGNDKGKEKTCERVSSDNTPSNLDANVMVPMAWSVRKQAELNKALQTRRGAREMYCAAGVKPQSKVSHPSRSSSLPSAPSKHSNTARVSIQPGRALSAEGTIPKEEWQHSSETNSASETKSNRNPRVSLFHRKTVSSTARTSAKSEERKSTASPNIRTSQVSYQSNHSSLGNVGIGMKKLGKKVGKIISGRRPRAIASAATGATITGVESPESSNPASRLRRQSSPLLTTYQNSGMDNSAADDIQFSPANEQIEHKVVGAQSSINSNSPSEIIYQNAGIQANSLGYLIAQDTNTQHNAAEELATQDAGAGNASIERNAVGRLVAQDPNVQSNDQVPNQQHPNVSSNPPVRPSAQSIPAGNNLGGNRLVRPPVQGITAGNNLGANNPAVHPLDQGVPAENYFDADNAAARYEDATDNLLRFVDTNVRQWVLRAREMEDSPARNYLIQAATQTANGLTMARELRMASIRLDQILHGLAGRLVGTAVGVAMAFNTFPR
jgi:hypothetical protein